MSIWNILKMPTSFKCALGESEQSRRGHGGDYTYSAHYSVAPFQAGGVASHEAARVCAVWKNTSRRCLVLCIENMLVLPSRLLSIGRQFHHCLDHAPRKSTIAENSHLTFFLMKCLKLEYLKSSDNGQRHSPDAAIANSQTRSRRSITTRWLGRAGTTS